MGFELIALIAGIVIGAAIVYFFGSANKSRKKHWSDGYMVVGRNVAIKKEAEKQQEAGSIFPPGW
jgi:hypothetical protein